MRTACLKATIVGLVLAAFTGLTPRSGAQQITTIVPFDALWRYNQSGTDLGTAWRAVSYPAESTWAQGQGLLQGGETTVYPAPFLTNISPPNGRITDYFRHTFNYNGTLSGISIFATNFVDDGCVIYLNGSEAGRIRVPAGQLFNTPASGGPAAEGQVDLLTFDPALLRVGQNVLAVEVHQNNTTSSDIVWGTRVVVVQPTQLTITTQPQSVSAIAGDTVTFTVGVSGGPISYQWQKDQVNIPGATGSSYTISPVSIGNAGTYRVIVSNALGSRTSSDAVLTVFQDTEGPTIESVIVQDFGQTNNVDVLMSEALTFSTANSNNIRVVRSGTFGPTSDYVIISNVLVSGRTIRLRVGGDNWKFFDNYYIIVNNLADSKGNLIAPNAVMPVSWRVRTNATRMNSTWDYYALNSFAANPDAIYTNNQWYKTNFVIDPVLWGRDSGIFWFDQDPTTTLCFGDGLNEVPLGFFDYENPTLFRSTFNIGTNYGTSGFISASLGIRNFVDDGFVLYLNGQEVYRLNAPPGPVVRGMRASTPINAVCNTNIEISVTNLLPRTNWLAAAVLNQSGVDGDMYFGLAIDGIFLKSGQVPTDGPTNSLRLTATKQGSSVRLTWPSTTPNFYYGHILEEARDLGNPGRTTSWLSVSNQANGMLISPTEPRRFYRLRKGPNSGL